MRPSRLIRLLPCLTFGCSLVAGFDEFSAAGAGGAGGEGARLGEAGDGGSVSAGRGAGPSAGGTGHGGSGGTAGNGTPTAGTAGGANATGGSGSGSGGDGSGASGGSGATGGRDGTSGEGGADDGSGGSANPNGGSGGTAGQGGTDASGGSAGFAGEASCGELLVNGDFELGPSPEWKEYTNYSDDLEIVVRADNQFLLEEGGAPQGGQYLAWLGGIPDNEYDSHMVRLRQAIRIPSDTSRLTLSGGLWIKTEETPDDDYDVARALIVREEEDNGATVFHQFGEWTNRDSSAGYVELDEWTTELDDLRGKTLTLEVYAITDPEFKTSFWFDELSLYAECER